MSASEKLKELDEQLIHVRPWGNPMWNLRAALPQMVAVVEMIEENHPYDGESHCPECAALIALDEALG